MGLVAAAGWASMSIAACGGAPEQVVDAFGTGGTTGFASFVPLPEGEVSGGFRELGELTGPVERLEYTLDTEKRLYLIRGDLNARLDPITGPIDTLRFPQTAFLGAGALETRSVDVGVDQNWGSLRVYDMGLCSAFFPWREVQILMRRLASNALFETGRFGRPSAIEAAPAGTSNIGPILVRRSGVNGLDEVRFNFTYRSRSADGCAPMVADLETRFGVRETPATLLDSCTGEPRLGLLGLRDFELQPLEVRAEIRDFCIGEGPPFLLEDAMIAAISTSVPANFIRFVDSVSRFRGFTIFPGTDLSCSCDSDCEILGFRTTVGDRSRCIAGECEVRAELERLFLMPEGLVIVYSEDASDPQDQVLQSPAFEQAFYEAYAGVGASPDDVRLRTGVDYGCGGSHAPFTRSADTVPTVVPILRVFDPAGL